MIRRAGYLRRAISAFLLAFFLAGLLLPVTRVQAHAQLVGANPSPGQVLTSFPTTAELDFSEAVDLASARVQLINASGEVIANGKPRLNPNSSRSLLVDLPSQRDGVYSLDWKVTSAVDGHQTEGTIAFSVGLSSPRASMLPPPGTPDPATDLPPVGEVLLRWLTYLSIAVTTGGAFFALLAWQPAFIRIPGHENLLEVDERARVLLEHLVRYGAIGALVSLLGVLIEQALTLTPDPQLPAWQALLQAFGHHEGALVWVRILALILITVISTLPKRPGVPGSLPWFLMLALGLITEFTYSISGHNAALGTFLPIIADWLHFAAMSAWLGGLLPLGIVLRWTKDSGDPATTGLLDRVSRKFSRLALISVGILALTGLYSALLQVRTLQALVETRYGQAILLKTGLFLALIGLGALNQQIVLPRVARMGQRALDWLGRSARLEVALGGLLLLAVGGLVASSPAYDALQADHRQGLHETWQGDGVSLGFRVAPVQVGENEFGVDVADHRPGANPVAGVVILRIQPADESSGQIQVEARQAGGPRYTARGSYFSRMAAWDVLVIWRKPGFDDVTHVFPVNLIQWAEATGQKVNPVPADAASAADGHTLYLTNCAPCHGASGKGDGPAGRSLNPAPADLVQHSAPGVHTDGQLFDWITDGYPGSAMPAFKDQLTDKQRWDIINFLRTLAKGGASSN